MRIAYPLVIVPLLTFLPACDSSDTNRPSDAARDGGSLATDAQQADARALDLEAGLDDAGLPSGDGGVNEEDASQEASVESDAQGPDGGEPEPELPWPEASERSYWFYDALALDPKEPARRFVSYEEVHAVVSSGTFHPETFSVSAPRGRYALGVLREALNTGRMFRIDARTSVAIERTFLSNSVVPSIASKSRFCLLRVVTDWADPLRSQVLFTVAGSNQACSPLSTGGTCHGAARQPSRRDLLWRLRSQVRAARSEHRRD